MNRKVLQNKAYLMAHSFNRTKMFHSKKGWLVSTALILAMLGAGANVSHAQVYADTNNLNNQQTKPTNPVQNKASDKSTTPTSASSTLVNQKNVASQASQMHAGLMKLGLSKSTSSVASSSSNSAPKPSAKPTSASSASSSSSDMTTFKLGTRSQQAKVWNYVQDGLKNNDFDNYKPSSSSISSTTRPASSTTSSTASSKSSTSASSSNAPKQVSNIHHNMLGTLNPLETNPSNVTKSGQQPVIKRNLGDVNYFSGSYTSGNDDGLNYKAYKNGGVEFTDGTANNDLSTFSYSSAHNNSIVYKSDIHNAKAIKFDDGIDTNHVTNMSNMFQNASNLQFIDFGDKFDTSHVTRMDYMFMGDNSLQSLVLPSSFNTHNVTSMLQMFNEDKSLKQLVLPNSFDTSNVSDMRLIFHSDSSLPSLTLPDSFSTKKAEYSYNMFSGDKSLTSLTIQSPNTVIYDISGFDDQQGLPTMYRVYSFPYVSYDSHNFVNSDNNVGTFITNPQLDTITYKGAPKFTLDSITATTVNVVPNANTQVSVPAPDYCEYINNSNGTFNSNEKNVTFDVSPEWDGLTYKCHNGVVEFTGGTAQSDLSDFGNSTYDIYHKEKSFNDDTEEIEHTFNPIVTQYVNKHSDVSVKFDNDIDTSHVTNMSHMFNNSFISHIDFGNHFDTSHVTNMSGMFSDADLKSLVLPSSFNTSHVTNMSHMFNNSFISHIDFGNHFDTSHVTNMSGMFSNVDLKSLVLPSSFNTSHVTNMDSMFNNSDLKSLVLPSSFDTSHVTSMKDMFAPSSSTLYNTGHYFDVPLTYLQSITIQSPKTRFNDSSNINNYYFGKELPETDEFNNYYTSFVNNFNQGNVGTFIPINIKPSTVTFHDIYQNIDDLHGIPSDQEFNWEAPTDGNYSINLPAGWAFVNSNGDNIGRTKAFTYGSGNHNLNIAPSDDGLIYKYNYRNNSVEFVQGTPNSDLSNFSKNSIINNATSIKFDNNINTINVKNMTNLLSNSNTLQNVYFGSNFNTNGIRKNIFTNDVNLQSVTVTSPNTKFSDVIVPIKDTNPNKSLVNAINSKIKSLHGPINWHLSGHRIWNPKHLKRAAPNEAITYGSHTSNTKLFPISILHSTITIQKGDKMQTLINPITHPSVSPLTLIPVKKAPATKPFRVRAIMYPESSNDIYIEYGIGNHDFWAALPKSSGQSTSNEATKVQPMYKQTLSNRFTAPTPNEFTQGNTGTFVRHHKIPEDTVEYYTPSDLVNGQPKPNARPLAVQKFRAHEAHYDYINDKYKKLNVNKHVEPPMNATNTKIPSDVQKLFKDYHFVNPKNRIKLNEKTYYIEIEPDQVTGTVTLHLIYNETNGKTNSQGINSNKPNYTQSDNIQLPVTATFGENPVVISPWSNNYAKPNYRVMSPVWEITASDIRNQRNLSNTFTYTGQPASIDITYVDVTPGAQPSPEYNKQTVTFKDKQYPIVGHQNLSDAGVIGQEVNLTSKNLTPPAGFQFYDPKNNWRLLVPLDKPKVTLTLMARLGSAKPAIPQKPLKPATSSVVKPAVPSSASQPSSGSAVIPSPAVINPSVTTKSAQSSVSDQVVQVPSKPKELPQVIKGNHLNHSDITKVNHSNHNVDTTLDSSFADQPKMAQGSQHRIIAVRPSNPNLSIYSAKPRQSLKLPQNETTKEFIKSPVVKPHLAVRLPHDDVITHQVGRHHASSAKLPQTNESTPNIMILAVSLIMLSAGLAGIDDKHKAIK